jgi:arylsulfatase A-like enzyme
MASLGLVGQNAAQAAGAKKSGGDQKRQPNIIFVFADQMRADMLGYAGDKNAVTPNIDRFARQAVDFTNATVSTPVSAAYRGSLLTGKYASSTGMIINEINMNPNHRFIAHCLSDAGYDVGWIGKLHLNDLYLRPYQPGPERFGFDGYWAAYSFRHNSYHPIYHTDIDGRYNVEVDRPGVYEPAMYTDLLMDYVRDAVEEDKPFAAFMSWNPPHAPWTRRNVVEEYYQMFKDLDYQLPANFSAPDPYMDRFFNGSFDNGPKGKEWNRKFLDEGLKEWVRCYYAMNHSIDEQFGRILEMVDSLGIADNTIVVFTSDHGEMFASHGRLDKLIFYDEAARIPFLVRAPGGKRGKSSDVLLNTPDIMPTLLGLSGNAALIPAEVEGMDLSHAVYGKKGDEPQFALLQGMGHTHLWKDGHEWRAVRDKRYTFARYLVDGSELLFDRADDPEQMVNLIDDPKYAEVAERLRTGMRDKMAELNDQFKPCTWYRDNWMYKTYSIKAAARGEFGPVPPLEPQRK